MKQKLTKNKIQINYQEKNNQGYPIFLNNLEKYFKLFIFYFKKIFKFTLIFFFFIAIILGLIYGISGTIFHGGTVIENTRSFEDIIIEIITGILMALYIIFVPAIVWILNLLQSLIYIMSFYPIILNALSISAKTFLIWSIVILIAVGTVFLLIKLFKIFWSRSNAQKEGSNLFFNIFQLLLLIILVPYVIFFLNVLVIFLISIIFHLSSQSDSNLALIIFNNSFYDYPHDFSTIPLNPFDADLQNFSFIVFMITTSILTYLIAWIVFDLGIRIYEIFILMFVSPIVISISVSDDSTRFKFWFQVINYKIFNVVFLFGGYTLYIASLPYITSFAYNKLTNFSSMIQEGFIIVMIISGAYMLESSKALIAFIFGAGTNVGFATTISNLSARTQHYQKNLWKEGKLLATPYVYGAKSIKKLSSKTRIHEQRNLRNLNRFEKPGTKK